MAIISEAGKVTAIASGVATITVTTANGKTATCEVTVLKPVLLGDVNQDEKLSVADVVT